MQRGRIIAERFAIDGLVGAGGMGSIFRAHDRQSGRTVALKTLLSNQMAERFVREAEVLAGIEHPAVVRYIAHGTMEEGGLYLAMELLEGEDLARRLKRLELTLGETLALGKRIAGALGAAHARGVVHRDIKPGNLFLPGGDIHQTKLLDFGIAHLGKVEGMTRTGIMLGTPGYIAPEQARGLPGIDARADVFALGCVLYRCLAGRVPFEGVDMVAVLVKLVFEEPPRLAELRPDLPPALDALVARMMAKSPEDRPADGAAVAQALDLILVAEGADGDALEIRAEDTESLTPMPGLADALEPEPAGPGITGAEQRLVSVVVSSAPAGEGAAAWSRTPGGSEIWSRLAGALRPFGAELVGLADGSLVAMVEARGEAADQAAQAARCALAIHRELPERDLVLATGRRVLAGRLPVGEAVDRAASLLQRAASLPRGAGAVRLDELTSGLIKSRFEVTSDPVSLVLLGEREAFEGGESTLLGKPMPCLGRERELGELEETLSACVDGPSARAALVTAPAGAGKSRLRHELLRRLMKRDVPVSVWMARGDPMGRGSPFRMLGQLIRWALRLVEDEPLALRRRTLVVRLSRYFVGEDLDRLAVFLGEIAGIPFPEEGNQALAAARRNPVLLGDQTRRAWEDFVAAACEERPLLVVLEDLHWGDLPTVQWIESALRNLADRPLMVLGLGRPELREIFPDLWADRGLCQLSLGELPARAAEKLVRLALGDRLRPEKVVEIVERAAGNAFFLEEMIRAVAEGRGDRLPGTVLAMIEARLDRLDPDARRVLRAASVFGKVFPESGVTTLLGGAPHGLQASAQLGALARLEIISCQRDDTLSGEQEYVFRNDLMREASYATLTDDDRLLGHRLAAGWLERAGWNDPVGLAEHFEQGGEPGKAVAHYLAAAEQALGGNDFSAALARARRGIGCGAQGERLGALRQVEGAAHKWLGNNVEAESATAEAMRALPAGGERWLLAIADLATVAAKMGHHERLLALAPELAELRAPAAPGALAVASARVAIQLLHAGHLTVADGLLGSAERAAAGFVAGTPTVVACLNQARAVRAMFWGDVGAFRDLTQAAAEAFERAGDLRSAATQRANVAYGSIELGAYAPAERALREALATAERMGLRDLAAGARHNLGIALARQGALEEAKAVESAAVRASVAQRNRRLESGCRTYLATILLISNDLTGAEREARAAVDILSVAPPMRAHALGTLGRVLLGQGRPAEALAATSEAVTLMQSEEGIEEGEALVHLAHVEALAAGGHHEAVRRMIAHARDRLLARAQRISDPASRASFLTRVPDNARLLELGRVWLGG